MKAKLNGKIIQKNICYTKSKIKIQNKRISIFTFHLPYDYREY
jgi:hypothetical protein